ncbi:amidohydrolase [Patulibacter defluvii]|uniref:amidohydrolase n=1 Tax=Patulibacter defluvii TaxID=3095358 RepID=UPI002A7618DA|nr:amidohydrolase [Patulibacter sp. DM4]
MLTETERLVDQVLPSVVAWRRHLHQHPELSFEEQRTAAWIQQRLEELPGVTVERPVGTAVVGLLTGARPGPTIAVRADIDALPIEEQTGLPFASRTPGVMHACGHDGHTAILLGAATVLSALRDQLAGEVRFLFEPGEEALPGGASQMVAAGVMRGVDRVLGLHLWAPLERGTAIVSPGRVMAACDVFTIEIHGRAGHIGAPHAAIDPIAIAAQIVTNLQHLVAREVDPLEPAVVGVTELHAGRSVGVIPAVATIGGGTNMFDPAVRDHLERRIGEIADGLCSAHGATCDYRYVRGYDAVVNDPATAAVVAETAVALLGPEAVSDGPPVMPGEDFSAFLREAPGCFVLLGAGNAAKGITADHHDSRFDIDEDALPTGVRLFVRSVLTLLEREPAAVAA